MRNKCAISLVFLSLRCVAERVACSGMRLADEQKSRSIRRICFASSPNFQPAWNKPERWIGSRT